MRLHVALAGAALFLACGTPAGAPASGPSAESAPPVAEKPTATVAPAPTLEVFRFPDDLPLLIGTSAGELRRYRGGSWELVAVVCPAKDPGVDAIAGVRASAGGVTAVVLCNTRPGDDANQLVAVDLASRKTRVVREAGGYRLADVSADGKQAVVVGRGDCPTPAPVCRSRWYLVDLGSGSRRELLPSGYYLGMEMRWTALGLTYFQPECASAGCAGAARAGTYVWDSAAWKKWSAYRFVDGDGNGAVLERRLELTTGVEGVTVLERVGDTEHLVTPPAVAAEGALARLSDGRVLTFRPAPGSSIYDGSVVVYQGRSAVSETKGRLGVFNLMRNERFIVTTALEGAPSWSINVYEIATGRFASRPANIWISGIALIPR